MDEEEEQMVELAEPPWVQNSLQTLPFFVKVRPCAPARGLPARPQPAGSRAHAEAAVAVSALALNSLPPALPPAARSS
jgi:hypothetical protein